MRIEGFVTTYTADDGKTHIYFFPGRDTNRNVLCKMYFVTQDIDYLYTRKSDGAIDYIINSAKSDTVTFRLSDIKTGKTEEKTIKLGNKT